LPSFLRMSSNSLLSSIFIAFKLLCLEQLHLKITSWERAFSEIDLSSISGNIFLIKSRRLSFDLNRSSLKELISLNLSTRSETSRGSESFLGRS